jgi:superfamily II DNA helicase RecQ
VYIIEAGRAGRDGLLAHCILFYSRADACAMFSNISNTAFAQEEGNKIWKLSTMYLHEFPALMMLKWTTELSTCRKSFLLQ